MTEDLTRTYPRSTVPAGLFWPPDMDCLASECRAQAEQCRTRAEMASDEGVQALLVSNGAEAG